MAYNVIIPATITSLGAAPRNGEAPMINKGNKLKISIESSNKLTVTDLEGRGPVYITERDLVQILSNDCIENGVTKSEYVIGYSAGNSPMFFNKNILETRDPGIKIMEEPALKRSPLKQDIGKLVNIHGVGFCIYYGEFGVLNQQTNSSAIKLTESSNFHVFKTLVTNKFITNYTSNTAVFNDFLAEKTSSSNFMEVFYSSAMTDIGCILYYDSYLLYEDFLKDKTSNIRANNWSNIAPYNVLVSVASGSTFHSIKIRDMDGEQITRLSFDPYNEKRDRKSNKVVFIQSMGFSKPITIR